MVRLLAIHAHPDDETLASGVTLAHHVAAGDEVHVLTLTHGEEGEVIPEDLAHLELPAGGERDPNAADPLAEVRRTELTEAMERLGVSGWTVLGDRGGPTRRDSGMVGTPSAAHPRALTGADLGQVADQVRDQIERVDPDLVVTYDHSGGYGHPDHVRTHEVVLAAVAGMARPPRLFAIVTPRSWYEQDQAWLREQLTPARRREWGATPPDPADHTAQVSVVPDEDVTHVVVDPDVVERQRAALAAHRTQVRLIPGMSVLSNGIASRTAGREAFQELDPRTGVPLPAQGGALEARPQPGPGQEER